MRPAAARWDAKVQVAASCWSGGMITGGAQGRQPGSAWKPFVLATAFEQGIQPSTTYDAPCVYQIPGAPCPRASRRATARSTTTSPARSARYPLTEATWQSINTVYAQLAPEVGCPNVATTAKKLGVESAYYSTPPFYYCQSYALGEVDVSPLDMASAYGVFADHGQEATPTPILEMVNAQGKVLVNNITPLPKTTTALPANVADNVTNVLQGVIPAGPARPPNWTARPPGRPAPRATTPTPGSSATRRRCPTAVWMGNAVSRDADGGR